MYQIVNQNDNELEIFLYSLIARGVTASQVIALISQSKAEKITLRINSDGGEVFESIALYNYLKDKDVHVIIDGIAASGASIVAMAGKTITMNQGSMMMMHQPLTLAIGNADELREEADILDKVTDNIAGIYSARSGMSKDEVLNLMKAETWLQDYECLAYGLADEIDAASAEADIKEEEEQQGEEPERIENSALYREGVRAERERLRELDELFAPGREEILNAAKYETYEHAEDVAIKLLKNEPPREIRQRKRQSLNEDVTVNSLPAGRSEDEDIRSMAEIINKWRA